MGGDGRGGTGEQAQEGVRAVAGQFHLAGDLLEGGLDPLRHSAMIFCRIGGMPRRWSLAGGTSTAMPLLAWVAVESLVCEQVSRRRPGLRQVAGDIALAGRGGHDAPGPHDPAAEVGLDGHPEAAGSLGMRAVAAEAGHQAAAGGAGGDRTHDRRIMSPLL
jgi:hypothetical protein